MRLHNIEVLVAEDERQAKVLAALAVKRGWMSKGIQKVWRLTLPKDISASSCLAEMIHIRDKVFTKENSNETSR